MSWKEPLEAMLSETQTAVSVGLWYCALSTALLTPDICGVVEYPSARPRERYAYWYDRFVASRYTAPGNVIDGSIIYKCRNALIHEATGFTRGVEGFDRIAFAVPSPKFFFDASITQPLGQETVFWISIPVFVSAICHGALAWLREIDEANDLTKQNALNKLALLRPKGLPNHIEGYPVIC